MLKKLYGFAAIITIIFLLAPGLKAQTIRVLAGVDEETGIMSYIEAFEYDVVTEKPTFPGGEGKLTEFINTNRLYPQEAYNKGIQGRVTCWFIVNADGRVSNVSLLRSVNSLLDEEAIRVFGLMPPWIPGRMEGIPVPVRVVRSVCFRK